MIKSMKTFTLAILGGLCVIASLRAEDLSIRADYPGGNIHVESNDGATVHLAPDLRDNKKDWFYWNFEATAAKPGPVRFVFTGARVGSRGPAVSLDGGQTWKWLGKEAVNYSVPREKSEESFDFDFTKAGQKVRFAMGFPYVQSNLEGFLKEKAKNPNLTASVLTTSNGGRPVELLQIGKPGEGVTSVLVGARSHACEALASYVLEGFLDEALSDSPSGIAFRKKYVLYAVPFIDKDGVEQGDQGKNRGPHDHNRDYGPNPIYPEIAAIQNLAVEKKVRVAIDFHCPYLRGDIHEAYHWLGLKVPHEEDNVGELSAWLEEERPLAANTAIPFLAKLAVAEGKTENIPFSWYFSQQPENLLGVTLESPYAQAETVDEARDYGRGLLRALVRTELVGPEPGIARGKGSRAALAKYVGDLAKLHGDPTRAKEVAAEALENPAAPSVFKAQANLSLSTVALRQKQYEEAVGYARAAAAEPDATAKQKILALIQEATVLATSPESNPEELEAVVRKIEASSFAAPSNRADVYEQASNLYAARDQLPKALEYIQKCGKTCLDWKKSGTLLREAEILDALNKAPEALERRKDVVALLKPQMLPAPKGKSIFLGTMTGNYFDAVVSLPTSTKEEKVEAAQVVLNFPTLPGGLRERVQEWLANNP